MQDAWVGSCHLVSVCHTAATNSCVAFGKIDSGFSRRPGILVIYLARPQEQVQAARSRDSPAAARCVAISATASWRLSKCAQCTTAAPSCPGRLKSGSEDVADTACTAPFTGLRPSGCTACACTTAAQLSIE